MSSLKEFLNLRVISTDARVFEGRLVGFDKSTNIVLSNCLERIVRVEEADEYEELELGIYLLRGGNVVCVGEVEEDVDWKMVRGEKLKGTKNPL